MNKSINFVSLLSICLLTSCSIFKGSSGEPDTQGKEIPKTTKPKQMPEKMARPFEGTSVSNVVKSDTPEGRTIAGFIEPNVTKLPDNKDLQESNNVAPPLTPKLEVPVAPLIIDPSAPLPSNS